MSAHQVVIEQRLRSQWLAVVIALAMVVLGVGGVVVAFVGGSSGVSWIVAIIEFVVLFGLLIALRLLAYVIIRIVQTDDGRCVEVVYGAKGMVRQTFSASQVLGAHTTTVSVAKAGGWGYRGSLKLFKWAALVTRGGPALELQLSGGRRFVVTLDDPDDFVTALT